MNMASEVVVVVAGSEGPAEIHRTEVCDLRRTAERRAIRARRIAHARVAEPSAWRRLVIRLAAEAVTSGALHQLPVVSRPGSNTSRQSSFSLRCGSGAERSPREGR